MNGLLANPVISGLLGGGPNAIRAAAEQQRMALAPRGGGGMSGAPGAIVTQDRSGADLGAGLAGLGKGLSAIGKMRDRAAQKEAFDAAIATLPPEQQTIARLNPEAFAKAYAEAMSRPPEKMTTANTALFDVDGKPRRMALDAGMNAGLPEWRDQPDMKTFGNDAVGYYALKQTPGGGIEKIDLVEGLGREQTALQQDYQYARKVNGYPGTLADFIQATRQNTVERAPPGYERTPDGGMRAVPGGPADPNAPTTAPVASTTTPPGRRIGNLGVPLPDTDPTAGLPAEQRAKLAAKIREDAIKEFAGSQGAVDQARDVNDRLDRFVQLIDEGMNTGGQYKIPGATMVGSTLSPRVSEAQSIVDMMTPMMRQGMPGAASDRDVAMFRGATVGMDKPEDANRNIATGLMASRQNLIERDQFMRAYFDQNGHLQGSDRAWQKYLNANPIFDHSAPKGAYNLNDKRTDWRSWFSGSEQSGSSPAPAATSSSIPPPPSGFVVSP
jgi:hypothetical protein